MAAVQLLSWWRRPTSPCGGTVVSAKVGGNEIQPTWKRLQESIFHMKQLLEKERMNRTKEREEMQKARRMDREQWMAKEMYLLSKIEKLEGKLRTKPCQFNKDRKTSLSEETAQSSKDRGTGNTSQVAVELRKERVEKAKLKMKNSALVTHLEELAEACDELKDELEEKEKELNRVETKWMIEKNKAYGIMCVMEELRAKNQEVYDRYKAMLEEKMEKLEREREMIRDPVNALEREIREREDKILSAVPGMVLQKQRLMQELREKHMCSVIENMSKKERKEWKKMQKKREKEAERQKKAEEKREREQQQAMKQAGERNQGRRSFWRRLLCWRSSFVLAWMLRYLLPDGSEGLVVTGCTTTIPDSDAGHEDALYGPSVEVGEDVRRQTKLPEPTQEEEALYLTDLTATTVDIEQALMITMSRPVSLKFKKMDHHMTDLRADLDFLNGKISCLGGGGNEIQPTWKRLQESIFHMKQLLEKERMNRTKEREEMQKARRMDREQWMAKEMYLLSKIEKLEGKLRTKPCQFNKDRKTSLSEETAQSSKDRGTGNTSQVAEELRKERVEKAKLKMKNSALVTHLEELAEACDELKDELEEKEKELNRVETKWMIEKNKAYGIMCVMEELRAKNQEVYNRYMAMLEEKMEKLEREREMIRDPVNALEREIKEREDKILSAVPGMVLQKQRLMQELREKHMCSVIENMSKKERKEWKKMQKKREKEAERQKKAEEKREREQQQAMKQAGERNQGRRSFWRRLLCWRSPVVLAWMLRYLLPDGSEGLAVTGCTTTIPDSAGLEDALYGPSVEVGEDVRRQTKLPEPTQEEETLYLTDPTATTVDIEQALMIPMSRPDLRADLDFLNGKISCLGGGGNEIQPTWKRLQESIFHMKQLLEKERMNQTKEREEMQKARRMDREQWMAKEMYLLSKIEKLEGKLRTKPCQFNKDRKTSLSEETAQSSKDRGTGNTTQVAEELRKERVEKAKLKMKNSALVTHLEELAEACDELKDELEEKEKELNRVETKWMIEKNKAYGIMCVMEELRAKNQEVYNRYKAMLEEKMEKLEREREIIRDPVNALEREIKEREDKILSAVPGMVLQKQRLMQELREKHMRSVIENMSKKERKEWKKMQKKREKEAERQKKAEEKREREQQQAMKQAGERNQERRSFWRRLLCWRSLSPHTTPPSFSLLLRLEDLKAGTQRKMSEKELKVWEQEIENILKDEKEEQRRKLYLQKTEEVKARRTVLKEKEHNLQEELTETKHNFEENMRRVAEEGKIMKDPLKKERKERENQKEQKHKEELLQAEDEETQESSESARKKKNRFLKIRTRLELQPGDTYWIWKPKVYIVIK
ncbi:hypothetical protein NFI96_010160 [Prochilodus magdalenae]|nr:hypothetical protein NFI96_010160 [Prochilodus magdalenae]